jgi:hypothetical protein
MKLKDTIEGKSIREERDKLMQQIRKLASGNNN